MFLPVLGWNDVVGYEKYYRNGELNWGRFYFRYYSLKAWRNFDYRYEEESFFQILVEQGMKGADF